MMAEQGTLRVPCFFCAVSCLSYAMGCGILFIASGAVAQLGERLVRNEEVGGSNPPSSTLFLLSIPPPVYYPPLRKRNVCRQDGEPSPERLRAMMDFKERYRSAIRSLIGQYYPSDGVSEKNLSAMEMRLQVKIPGALRDYYLVSGGLLELNEAYHRLLHPNRIRVEDGKLIFMEGYQNAVVWGSDCLSGEYDPIVYREDRSPAHPEWISEEISCSDFLHVMLYWQSVSGGMEFQGSAMLSDENFRKMRRDWEYVGGIGSLKAYQRYRMALCATASGEGVSLMYGASDRGAFDLILQELREYGSV